ncbi:MAG TPA: DUF3168 domain-containing protein [Gemmata sp.]
MAAATAAIAVVARLKEATAVAGGRVYPQTNTPEGDAPFVLVTQTAAATGARLSGKRPGLNAATVEIACYATTQAGAAALAKEVRDRLAPTGAPWRNLTDGVQGCFYQDGNEERNGSEQDTERVVRDTYLVWHSPT